MFLLMAEMVLLSGIADDLFKTAAAWMGRVPGGLGIATTLAGAGFGAICGTSSDRSGWWHCGGCCPRRCCEFS